MRKLGQCAIAILVLQIILICTGPPGFVGRWLNESGQPFHPEPRYVVVLGGSGVPSGTTLMRCYRAAELGRTLTNTTLIVALPSDEDPETSSVGRMRDELIMRGIAHERILMEFRGLNTRQQAANIRTLLGDGAVDEPLTIVTSQYHMRRAAGCFRKAGFTNVAGMSAHSVSAEAAPGPGAWLRYGIWNGAVAWVRVTRELVALITSSLIT